MHPPDDLDEYLRGDSALSCQYRRESAPVPPPALDRHVLELSREATNPPAAGDSRAARPQSPCLAPLAFAASVLLSVALVLAIVFGPQTVKRVDDTPHLVRAAARADGPAAALHGRDLRLYSSDPLRPRARAAWLADIAELRRAGRNREADAEMRRFRNAYPEYSTGDPTTRP
jgi:hypothetical protein